MMTLVVASLVERGIPGVARSSKKAFESGADAVEVRLDHMTGISRDPDLLEDVRAAVDGVGIATYRSLHEGGRGRLTGRRREDLQRNVLESGFEYVDLELERDRALLDELGGSSGGSKIIASFHLQRPTTVPRVRARLEEACSSADIGKVAMPCENAGHAVRLAKIGLEFRRRRKSFALMGMGGQGQLTRACAGEIGSELVYACLRGRPAAPGQFEVGLQKRLMAKEAFKLGLIGHPVGHSVSKPMQEAALRSARLDGVYMHLDFPPRAFTKEALETLFAAGMDGLNVTIPHKERAHELCDTRERTARSTGAVNTISKRRGRLVGENTDVIGFIKLLEHKRVHVKGTRVLVIGAGGAARAVCEALARNRARITVAARRPAQARKLADKFQAQWRPLSSTGAKLEGNAVVVNSTPVGTKGTDLERELFPKEVFAGCGVFVDLVYNPEVTRNMRAATKNGCLAYGGLEMLVRQGEEAFRMWTRKSPDAARMRVAARRALRR